MIRINLLDWRAERREKRQKQFATAAVFTALASGAIVFIAVTLANAAIEYQNKRNEFLKSQIREVDAQIKEIQELEKVKNDLIARMEVIEQLQRTRSQVVHYFDEIVNTLPEGLYLTGLSQKGNNTSITGTAESNGRVSSYMKNLDGSDWFANPNLVVIRVSESGFLRLSNFEMKVGSTQPKKGASEEVADTTEVEE